MNGAGIYNLGDRVITAALTDQVITESSLNNAVATYIGNLDGMTSVTLFADFEFGATGTTCIVVVQTSINQGADWIDIARFDFATSDAQKTANIAAAAAAAVAAVSALGSESKIDGVLGDRLRAKITTTGTYSVNTSVSVRAAVR